MLTIITSLYNSSKHIKRYKKFLVRSLTYFKRINFKYEVIIIANDPDEEENLVLDDIKKLDFNINIIKVTREGLYSSWNRGIKLSKGNVIAFWNVDDIRFARAMITGYNFINDNISEIVYFAFIIISKHRYYNYFPIPKIYIDYPKSFNKELFVTGAFCGPFYMFNKNIVNKIGYFDERFKIVGDMEFTIRAAKNEVRFAPIYRLAGIYIKFGNTISGARTIIGKNLQELENQIVYRKYLVVRKYLPLNISQKELLLKCYPDFFNLFKEEI